MFLPCLVGARGLEMYTWSLLVWVGVCAPVKKRVRNRERKRKYPKEKWTIDHSSKQDLQCKWIFFSENILLFISIIPVNIIVHKSREGVISDK